MDYEKLSLGWFLSHTNIDNLEYFGDPAFLCKPITGVNVLDNPDGIRWIKKNELVLSTGYIFYNDPVMQSQILKELHDIDCTAFCIKVKRYFEQIPETLLEEAASYGVPVVAVPYYHSFSDIMEIIFRELMERNTQQQQYIINETEKFYLLHFQNKGITKMLEQISSYYQSAVMITNTADFPVHYYAPVMEMEKEGKPDMPIRPLPDASYNGSLRTRDYNFFNQRLNFTFFPVPNGKNSLCIDTTAYQIEPSFWQLIQRVLPVLALELESIHTKNRFQNSRNYYASFFNMLSDMSSKSTEEVKIICDTYGFSYDHRRVCITFQVTSQAPWNKTFKNIYDQINQYLEKQNQKYFLCYHENYITLFLLFSKNYPGLQAMNTAVNISEQLFSSLSDYAPMLRIGVSRSHTRITSIGTAFEESVRSIHMQVQLGQPCQVSSFWSQNSYHLINQLSSYEIKKLYRDTVMQLVDYDSQNGTELLSTLKIYCENRFNVSETSKNMFIHRNTLTGRINQIKSLLGLDLDDINEIFSLYMGICAYELLHGL